MGKRYLVEEVDWEIETIGKIIAPILGIGLLILVNWFFLKSLTKIDIEVIGILIGIGLSLIVAICIFITRIKNGFYDSITIVFQSSFLTSFLLMLIGSILAPIIGQYIVFNKIEFLFWDLIKTVLFNSIILIISTPLVTVGITIITTIIGFILAFPIYRIIFLIKTKRIKNTECWEELKEFFKEINFKKNISKFDLYQDRVEFENVKNKEITLYSFKQRDYKNLSKTQQLTLINMIKKETKTSFKLEVNSYVNLYTAYNKYIIKKQNENVKNDNKRRKRNNKIKKYEQRKLNKLKKKKYKQEVKSGKNW